MAIIALIIILLELGMQFSPHLWNKVHITLKTHSINYHTVENNKS